MPLIYRDKGISGTQFDVLSHQLRIAHVGKDLMTAFQAVRWSWNFSIGNAVPRGFPHHGTAETFEEAKAIVDAAWETWLTAAGLSEK